MYMHIYTGEPDHNRKRSHDWFWGRDYERRQHAKRHAERVNMSYEQKIAIIRENDRKINNIINDGRRLRSTSNRKKVQLMREENKAIFLLLLDHAISQNINGIRPLLENLCALCRSNGAKKTQIE